MQCRKCEAVKPPSDFYVKGGKVCKTCKIHSTIARRSSCLKSFLSSLYSGCSMRHKRGCYVGELVGINRFWEVFLSQAGKCALTNEDFDLSLPQMRPSPDRIDNGMGYVEGNIQFVTWKANNMRGSLSMEEFRNTCIRVANM